MEPARAAARRLVARGEVEITQRGSVVDPSTAKGPVRRAAGPGTTGGPRGSPRGSPPLRPGMSLPGRDLVRRRLPLVPHRQAPLRGRPGPLRRTATRSSWCGAASSSTRGAPPSASRRSAPTPSAWREVRHRPEQAQAMIDSMTASAAQRAWTSASTCARPGNTFDAHRLLHLALAHGLQDALKERLDRATFTEGVPGRRAPGAARAGRRGRAAGRRGRRRPRSDRFAAGRPGRRGAGPRRTASPASRSSSSTASTASPARSPPTCCSPPCSEAWAERSPLTLVTSGGAPAEACDGDSCAV